MCAALRVFVVGFGLFVVVLVCSFVVVRLCCSSVLSVCPVRPSVCMSVCLCLSFVCTLLFLLFVVACVLFGHRAVLLVPVVTAFDELLRLMMQRPDVDKKCPVIMLFSMFPSPTLRPNIGILDMLHKRFVRFCVPPLHQRQTSQRNVMDRKIASTKKY